jgi:hypothetical protein
MAYISYVSDYGIIGIAKRSHKAMSFPPWGHLDIVGMVLFLCIG